MSAPTTFIQGPGEVIAGGAFEAIFQHNHLAYPSPVSSGDSLPPMEYFTDDEDSSSDGDGFSDIYGENANLARNILEGVLPKDDFESGLMQEIVMSIANTMPQAPLDEEELEGSSLQEEEIEELSLQLEETQEETQE
jgi:hypothetical protein